MNTSYTTQRKHNREAGTTQPTDSEGKRDQTNRIAQRISYDLPQFSGSDVA